MRTLFLLALLPAVASAQLSSLPPGAHVRGLIPSVLPTPLTATFVTATRDSIWLRDAYGPTGAGPFRAPRLALTHAQIAELSFHVRTDRRRGAQIGFLTGLVTGGALLGATSLAAPDSYAMLGAYFLALVLPPAGTLIGAAIGAQEWRQVVPASPPR